MGRTTCSYFCGACSAHLCDFGLSFDEIPVRVGTSHEQENPQDASHVLLSGDTRYSETLIRNAQGVDVLIHEVVFGPPGMTTERQLITNAHTLPHKAAQVFTATKPKLAIYSHLILFGVSDDDVMAATRKLYSGRVEMGTDLTAIDVGDTISVRRSK